MGNIYSASQVPDITLLGAEKRRHPRRRARWSFLGFDKEKRRISGITENVSKSGMLLICNEEYLTLDKGNRVFLSFKICYKNKMLEVRGVAKIKHATISTKGRKLGIEFINIPEEQKKFFSDYAIDKI